MSLRRACESAMVAVEAQFGRSDVVVWVADLDRLRTSTDNLEEFLDPEERSLAQRKRPGKVRNRFVARRHLRRAALGAHLACHPATLRFETTCLRCGAISHGRPELTGCRTTAFSATSSKNLALLAVDMTGAARIGADLVHRDQFYGLPATSFDDVTCGLLAIARRHAPGPEEIQAWAWLEAVSKAAGTGLAISPNELTESMFKWRATTLSPAEGSVAVLATQARPALVLMARLDDTQGGFFFLEPLLEEP